MDQVGVALKVTASEEAPSLTPVVDRAAIELEVLTWARLAASSKLVKGVRDCPSATPCRSMAEATQTEHRSAKYEFIIDSPRNRLEGCPSNHRQDSREDRRGS